MNKVILIGNLASEVEKKTTTSGITNATFRLAVQRRFTNAQGVREADFLPIVCWRQTAEFASKYLLKGRRVAVEGSIQTRSYDAQDGTKRYVTEIIADNLEVLDKADTKPDSAQTVSKAQNVFGEGFVEVDDGDALPF